MSRLREKITKRILVFRWLICAVVLFYYIWMAAQIPYAHDDWAWGVQTGLRWFLEASINSRYAGNAIEIVLTRSPFLKTLLMGFTFASIPIVSVGMVKNVEGCGCDSKEQEKYIYLFFLTNALMLFIPTDTWMQTFGWVAGFSNYVMVSLVMLVYLLVIIKSEVGRKTFKTVSLILLFFFGIIMQLFVENITVCTLIDRYFLHSRYREEQKNTTRLFNSVCWESDRDSDNVLKSYLYNIA